MATLKAFYLYDRKSNRYYSGGYGKGMEDFDSYSTEGAIPFVNCQKSDVLRYAKDKLNIPTNSLFVEEICYEKVRGEESPIYLLMAIEPNIHKS